MLYSLIMFKHWFWFAVSFNQLFIFIPVRKKLSFKNDIINLKLSASQIFIFKHVVLNLENIYTSVTAKNIPKILCKNWPQNSDIQLLVFNTTNEISIAHCIIIILNCGPLNWVCVSAYLRSWSRKLLLPVPCYSLLFRVIEEYKKTVSSHFLYSWHLTAKLI